MLLMFSMILSTCGGGGGGSPSASSKSSDVTYAQITNTSTPVTMEAVKNDGSESLTLLGNKDSSGNPTSINGIVYSSTTKGQLYFVIDTSSGLPTSVTDSFGNKINFSNYTANSVQVSVYNNNKLISGPSQMALNSSTLAQVKSLWSTLNGSLPSVSPSVNWRSSLNSNMLDFIRNAFKFASTEVSLIECALALAGAPETMGSSLALAAWTCSSAFISSQALISGNETVEIIDTAMGESSCAGDLLTMDANAFLDCCFSIIGLILDAQNPLPVPTGLALTTIGTQIDLSWNASTDSRIVGYNVYRSIAGSSFSKVMSASGTSASDTNLQLSTQYCYAISDYDASGNESLQSSIVCINTGNLSVQPLNPEIPYGTTTQFTAYITSLGGTQAIATQVTWSSSNPSIAKINSSGLATPVSLGNTTITATLGSVDASTVATVISPFEGSIQGQFTGLVSIVTAPCNGSNGGGAPLNGTMSLTIAADGSITGSAVSSSSSGSIVAQTDLNGNVSGTASAPGGSCSGSGTLAKNGNTLSWSGTWSCNGGCSDGGTWSAAGSMSGTGNVSY
jgi:hypothetical protein